MLRTIPSVRQKNTCGVQAMLNHSWWPIAAARWPRAERSRAPNGALLFDRVRPASHADHRLQERFHAPRRSISAQPACSSPRAIALANETLEEPTRSRAFAVGCDRHRQFMRARIATRNGNTGDDKLN